MSNPPNVLSDFSTYSYHHILIATDGAGTVQSLRDATDLNIFQRQSGADRYAPYEIPIKDGKLGRYVVLIDTMTDSKLAIESVQWETIIAPKREGGKTTGIRYGNTIEVDGEIVINEPYGLDFYQILGNAARDVNKSPASVIYVLKTIFVGRHSDGRTEMISSVRPFNFVITDIVSTIDTKGTMYKLEIVGMSNGVAKIPQHARAAEGINLTLAGGTSIRDAVKEFEKQLQIAYDGHISELYRELGQPADELNKQFQKVKYTFDVDPVYQQYITGDTINPQLKGEAKRFTLTTGPAGTIESMLHKIMNSCAQVDKDGQGKNKAGKYFIYKISSVVVPSPNDIYHIEFTIERYEMIRQKPESNVLEPKPGEFIEFDYMYTGLNVDVLNFDLKMDLGLTFFMTVASAPNLPRTAHEVVNGTPTGELGGVDTNNASTKAVTNPNPQLPIPLYFSTKEDDPHLRNKLDAVSGSTYAQLFERHAALEHVEASISIAGNPNLLDELTSPRTAEATVPTEGNTGALNVTRTPALIKVNVLFPSDTELTGVKEFWYKGFYNIYSITQKFDGGLFTQDISMFSVPQDSRREIDKLSGKAPQPLILRALVEYSAPPPGSPCTHEPYNYDLIVGYKASQHTNAPNFILKVEEIAAEIGTLPEWLIAVMSFETGGSFDPAQTTGASSAVGLIQFIEDTAIAFGTTTAALVQMTAVEQLTYVRLYFKDQLRRGLKLNTLEGLYTAVLHGTAQHDAQAVLFNSTQTTYANNAYLDINSDGNITIGEAVSEVAARLYKGVSAIRGLLLVNPLVPAAEKQAIASQTGERVSQELLDAIYQYQIAADLTITGYINDETVRTLTGLEQPSFTGCSDHEFLRDPKYPNNQRLHNPLNIIKVASNKWLGKLPSPDSRFENFTAPEYGLRAGYILLRESYFANGLKSVEQIISKWSPQSDNKPGSTGNYVTAVSSHLNVAPTEPLNINDDDDQLIEMAKAMAKWEGGATYEPYDDAVYTVALALI